MQFLRSLSWSKPLFIYLIYPDSYSVANLFLHRQKRNKSMLYQSVILLIFRPFVGHPSASLMGGFTETPRQIVISAASEICTVFAHYENAGFDNYPPGLMPHILLSAAMVFLREHMVPGSSPPSSSSVSPALLAHNLERCIFNLRKMSLAWDLSSQTLHVIWSWAASSSCNGSTDFLPSRVKDALFLNAEAIPPSVALMPLHPPSPPSEPGVLSVDKEENRKPMEFGFACGGGGGGRGFLGPNNHHRMPAGDGCDVDDGCLHLTAVAAEAGAMVTGSENDTCHWMDLQNSAATATAANVATTAGDEEILISASEVAGLLDDVVGCDGNFGIGTWDNHSMP